MSAVYTVYQIWVPKSGVYLRVCCVPIRSVLAHQYGFLTWTTHIHRPEREHLRTLVSLAPVQPCPPAPDSTLFGHQVLVRKLQSPAHGLRTLDPTPPVLKLPSRPGMTPVMSLPSLKAVV